MKHFTSKPTHELTEQDFRDHAVWAEYYEPDDISTLVSLGYNESEVRIELERIGYSDSHAFPLPPRAGREPFQYLFLAVRARTAGGSDLYGFVTGACLALYHAGECYRMNEALPSDALDSGRNLARVLGELTIWPVRYTIVATGESDVSDPTQP
jgi:hypothetical protein